MSLPELREAVLEVYTFLYTSVLDRSVQKINLAQNGQGATLDNFCAKIHKRYGDSIGTDWIVDYCLSQVHYWLEKDTQYKVTMGWILGDKALERYLKRPQGKDFYEDRMLKRKLRMTRGELKAKWRKSEKGHPLAVFTVLPHEDRIKAQFLNTEFGFFQCQSMTTLYSDCLPCRDCGSQKECKILLKKSFPELARLRGIH